MTLVAPGRRSGRVDPDVSDPTSETTDLDSVTRYALDVDAGRVVAGPFVRLAAQRHLRDLENGSARGLRFNREEAERAIAFYPAAMTHWKGEWAGERVVLEPWECFIVGSAFGWQRWDTSRLRWLRRFRLVYIEIAKKNGKTLLGAGFGLRLAFFDGEPGAEVYSCATKRDQAKFVWNDARRAVRRNPGLRRRIQIADSTSTLYDTLSGSKFEPLGRDSDTDQGINPNGAVLDELHVHRDRTLFDNVGTAMAARAQPMRVVITTAGVRRESIWWEVRTDVVRILDGRAEDDSVFGYVACLDEDDDPFDEAVWPKANPNLGISVGVDFLREQAAKAKRSAGERTSYMRFHMDMPTTSSTGAIDIADWDACDAPAQIAPGDVGFGGLDLAQLADLTALVKVFVRTDGYVDVASHFWCPEAAIDERSRLDGVPYRQWADEGWITVTPGDVTDFAFVRQTLLALPEQILEFGYDRWQAMQLALELEQDGAVMVPISQTTAGLAAGWHEIERLIAERKFRFDGNPVLRWMAGNVEVEVDAAGNRKPSKRASRERIDGMVALDMALSRALANPPPPEWRMA